MDFGLTDEQEMFRDMVREFARKEIRPVAKEIDQKPRFPHDVIKKMAELGLLGITTPEAYGGAGMDELSLILAIEEVSRACSSTAVTMAVHHSVVQEPIFRFGTEEQKQRFLVPLATGEYLGAFALTEPNAGSDAQNIQTTAAREGDVYCLNGTKTFITNGGVAGLSLVAAVTDRQDKKKRISLFLVEKGTPGFSVGKKEDKMGIRGSDTSELVFEDCRVSAAQRLGEEGEGFKILMKTLDGSRIGVAAQAVGIARSALDLAIDYAKNRQQFGQSLTNFQGIQFMMADMATEIDAAALLTYRAAVLKQQGKQIGKEASMAKLYAAEMVQRITSTSLQIHGGYGYIKDYDIERLYRDARVAAIYEGTSEIQRIVIARHVSQ